MIKNYAEPLKLTVPAELRQYVFAAIKGETESTIKETFPVHPIGFPIFVSVFNDVTKVFVKGKRSEPISRLTINGQIDRDDIELEMDGKFGQVGLVLAPTTTYYLLHRPGIYFLNHCRDFNAASPVGCGHLTVQLSQCRSPDERIPILLEIIALLAKNRLPAVEWLDISVADILSHNGMISQTELAEKSGIGVRHFRRKFKEIIGIAPKYFCKVIQLNTIFEHLKSSSANGLHRLALDCGYYDQAHFINDFNRLIGASPTDFLNGKHSYVKTYLGRKDF